MLEFRTIFAAAKWASRRFARSDVIERAPSLRPASLPTNLPAVSKGAARFGEQSSAIELAQVRPTEMEAHSEKHATATAAGTMHSLDGPDGPSESESESTSYSSPSAYRSNASSGVIHSQTVGRTVARMGNGKAPMGTTAAGSSLTHYAV